MRKILLGLILVVGAVIAGNIKDPDVAMYIHNCKNLQDKHYYKVCWNDDLGVAEAGWTVIDGSKIDKKNIIKRATFFIDDKVKTLKPEQIEMPNQRGHTFANDNNLDYNTEALKSTYNMINITAMHQTINVGAWRKVENRGNTIAKEDGKVTSITLVEYGDEKYNIQKYPVSYTRIYITEDIHECYKVDNLDRKSDKLESYKIDCQTLIKQ